MIEKLLEKIVRDWICSHLERVGTFSMALPEEGHKIDYVLLGSDKGD